MSVSDIATCPDCGHEFAVTHYGRHVPCPSCQTELDIQPDDPPEHGMITRADWKLALNGETTYLNELAEELTAAGYCEAVEQLRGQIETLRKALL